MRINAADKLLHDNKISWKAKGVYCFLLSHENEPNFSRELISEYGKGGTDSVKSALLELEKSGYIERRRARTSAGTFEWQTIILKE